jgi:Ser/Thr protein kinase RdoA (MazF antagonist)
LYASEKIIVEKQAGLLAMEDLTQRAEPLGFYRSATVEQCLNVATTLAKLQFVAQQKEFSKWWRKLRVSIHLEEIYNEYQNGAMPELKTIPEIFELLPKVSIVFEKAFGYYCLLDKPQKYGALTFCHGDMQPNNVMFKTDATGELTDQVAAFIDWQLVFCGWLSIRVLFSKIPFRQSSVRSGTFLHFLRGRTYS